MPTDASAIPAQSDVYCPACGYNLRGLTVVNRCPECGGAVDLSAPPVARVPWAHWRQLGRVRAFAETVWVATFAPGQVLHDAALPNRYRDGRVFRFTAVLLATLAASVGLWQVREAFADFR
ncbi:MAG TPA: hypothetical protein VK324_07325, partial [Tepidisphaeraceae bacterium]|nr:hypothetical protein [Tepidisphaeraceae bacterium]